MHERKRSPDNAGPRAGADRSRNTGVSDGSSAVVAAVTPADHTNEQMFWAWAWFTVSMVLLAGIVLLTGQKAGWW